MWLIRAVDLLFCHKKKWSSQACCNMDEPWKYAKWSVRHKGMDIVWFY